MDQCEPKRSFSHAQSISESVKSANLIVLRKEQKTLRNLGHVNEVICDDSERRPWKIRSTEIDADYEIRDLCEQFSTDCFMLANKNILLIGTERFH